MRIAIVEPYFGGSHRSWAEGYDRASSHDVTLITHDARFWKWRMQGGHVTLAEQTRQIVRDAGPFDLIVGSSLLDLAAYLGGLGEARGRAVTAVYMHENQLTYPTSPRDAPDETHAMINWSSMVVADHVFFNSRFHHDIWFEGVTGLLNRFPDHKHLHLVEGVEAKSSVLPVGVDLARFGEPGPDGPSPTPGEVPTVLWNHRWEHDKAPEDLLRALDALVARGLGLRVIVTGEHVPSTTDPFDELRATLGDRLLHAGHVDDDRYVELVRAADVVVSTARQEFFGVSITEAVYAGVFPVLPDRLVYPERIPAEHHSDCLYGGIDDLVERCAWAIENPAAAADIARDLAPTMARFDWTQLGPEYDRRLEQLT